MKGLKKMNAKFKEKALFVLEKLNDKKTTAVASAAAASSALMSAGVSAAESGGSQVTIPTIADSVTADMLNGIVTQMTALLPVCLPTVVGILAFRKGISFLFGLLHGA